MRIYAPVKDFDGLRNGVRFIRGVGNTDNLEVIPWFEERGYRIEKSLEKCDVVVEKFIEKCDEPTPVEVVEDDVDLDSMTPNELREWMKENGYGFKMKNIRSKEKLLEIIRG